jgi:hypothetical protein
VSNHLRLTAAQASITAEWQQMSDSRLLLLLHAHLHSICMGPPYKPNLQACSVFAKGMLTLSPELFVGMT